jgi:hypothetical protein
MIKWYSKTVKKIYWYNIKTPFYDYLNKKILNSLVSKLTASQWKKLLNTSFKGVKSYPKIDDKGRKVLFVEEIETK